ncbi:MAG: GNAT family N-acetyltransferase [Janthinobacterium lividum]
MTRHTRTPPEDAARAQGHERAEAAFSIREATLADLPAIVAIYNSTVASRQVTADTEPVSVESRRAWFATHDAARRPLWVAELDGVMLGWLSITDYKSRPAYSGTVEISLYLAAHARGRGIGSRLLMRAIEAAPGWGVHTLIGVVFAHNAPSVRLFDALGFAQWGRLPRVTVLDGVERDVLILGRRADLQNKDR